MILKHVFIQLINKKTRILVLSIILLLSYFAMLFILNPLYVYLVKSFSPIIDIQIKNRTELLLDWNTQEQPQSMMDTRDLVKQKLLERDNILAADYALTDLLPGSIHSIVNNYDQEDIFLVYCSVDFYKVFDIGVEQGRWFEETDTSNAYVPVVITKQHAQRIGIDLLSNDSKLAMTRYNQGKRDTVLYQVVGIVNDLENTRNDNDVRKNTFPVFIPSSSITKRYGNMYSDRLIMKVKEGTSDKEIMNGVEQIISKLDVDKYVYRYQVSTLQHRRQVQILEHFTNNKIPYGIIIITFIYILVVMFGNFWKLTNNRFAEIGIRKAVGHNTGSVMRYLLYENLLIFGFVMFVAAFLITSLYSHVFSGFHVSIFFLCAGLFLLVIIAASLIPVFRAGSVHPVNALSEE